MIEPDDEDPVGTATITSLLLVRHARSLANVDPSLYLTTPDHTIPLASPDDDEGARVAGDAIRGLGIAPENTCVWVSTYLRCAQTESLVMAHAFGDQSSRALRRESFLLREQEFGDWDGLTDDEIEARDKHRFEKRKRLLGSFGRFYFRYPNGESRADVVQRIAIFIGKVHRSRFAHHVIFLHGVTQRAFRMAWFNRPVTWFEDEPNPENASVLLIHRDDDGRWTERYLTGDEREA